MTIVTCISDLHGHYPELEGGDLLIVAGDWTKKDTISEIEDFEDWLLIQAYKKIIIIAGNHDNVVYECGWVDKGKIEYLLDSGTEFEGLRIWGSPWTKSFEGMNPHCKAFTLDTEEQLAEKWAMIPDDVNILVTHSPPFTIMDWTTDGYQVGSTSLMAHHMKRLNPRLWVFGHIHESYGQEGPFRWNNTQYVNASHVNEHYEPVNKPIRIIL
jgi:Icc-related predicted phosphoesterase